MHRLALLLLWTAAACLAQKDRTGEWGSVINWPHIPVAVGQIADGRVVTWSSTRPTTFPAGETLTYAAFYDPATNAVTVQQNFKHDMFCSGIASTADGRIIASGGGASVRTTTFVGMNQRWGQNWVQVGNMNQGRWYNTSVTLPQGNILTWWGRDANGVAEIMDMNTGLWTQMPNLNASSTADPNDNVDDDNQWYPHLHVAPDGRVFQAGPLKTLRFLNTAGAGSIATAGFRTPDGDRHRKLGFSVMYRPGRILFTGGRDDRYSPSVTNTAVIIDLNGGAPVTTQAANMNYARAFHYNVLLPNGEVMAVGGNTSGAKFSDNGGVLVPEIWNPDTNQWRMVAQQAQPRGYHGVALLMRDGRVFTGGGGLCGCAADHQNAQIFSPGYLFNADGTAAVRPTISSAAAELKASLTFNVTGSDNIASFNLIRLQGTTHGLNSDQRFLPVSFTKTGTGQYSLTLPSNANSMIAGMYWLFALTSAGTPSIGYPVQVYTDATWPGIGNAAPNIARGKAATQSSVYETAAASRAVDGNQNGSYDQGSVSHTQLDAQAWWQVDLGSVSNISNVRIWNRVDCCGDRLTNFHVFVSDQPFVGTSVAQIRAQAGVLDLPFPGTPGQSTVFAVNRTGRYVRVQLEGNNNLQLAEVEVFGAAGVVTNQPPTVSLTAPTAGAVFTAPASIAISANANDPNGNLARVEFLNGATVLGTDTTAPYSFTWTGVAAGSYTITARAVDTAGLTASASVNVTVNTGGATNVAPTVSITAPANNASFTAPASITISANASDANNNLARVEFLNGATVLGTDTTAPFSFTWTGVAAGSYTVTARAVDAAGLTASASVNVTVTAASTGGTFTSTVVSVNSGRCLDISGVSTADGANAIQWSCHGGANQNFRFTRIAGTTDVYNVAAVHSGKCLDVYGASTADGSRIVQWACHTGNNQRFRMTRQTDGTFRMTPLHSGKAVVMRGASTTNGAQAEQNVWTGAASQRWRVGGLQ